MSAIGPSLATERRAWQNKGFSDARYRSVKNPPEDRKHRAVYLAAWRAGQRERLEAEAEGRP